MRNYFRKSWHIAGMVIITGLLVFHLFPLPDSLNNKPVATLLLADNGELLSAIIAKDQQWRFPQTRQLPEKYQVAVTTFEDKYFYRHPGINPISIARAAWNNFREGRIVGGGSTITMQLARISRNNPSRTYLNKIIEMLLALKLEWHYSKAEILSLYASHAPYGGNTVGISAASWRYFGRNLNDICCDENSLHMTWAEAALLAVLPNSPALIHPGRGRDLLKQKRDRLLATLYSENKIDKNEHELSILEPLPDKPHAVPQLASHLLHTLIEQTSQQTILHSTLDANLQKKLLASGKFLGKNLQREGVHNLSIVVIDNQTLETRGYVGNITSEKNGGLYARDVDIATRPRSTGSILKPFLYALMLQSGNILPETLVADVPSNYQGFTPENYDHEYRGAVPAKQALSQSLNIPAVRMLHAYGIARFQDDLKQLGMSTLFRSADDYGLSLILGGAEGTLWELTSINARMLNVARQGWKSDASAEVARLKNVDNNATKINKFAISQGAAWLTLEALIDVVRPGNENVWRDFSSSQRIAWKTGTSYGLRDAWAIGNSGKFTVGIWAGNASGEGVAGLSGLNTAAPVLFEVFNLLGPATWISKPEAALKTVSTCKNDGYLANNHCETKAVNAPINSYFQQTSPFQKNIFLDKNLLADHLSFRVHGGCESVKNIEQVNWMVLPPLQEHYWKQVHNEYHRLPPWREDCVAELANYTDEIPMEIVYPLAGSKIYIPVELSGEKGRVVFKASHRNPSAKLYWHVDNIFMEETRLFHDIALDLTGGWHKLVLIDEIGNRLERWFKILDKQAS